MSDETQVETAAEVAAKTSSAIATTPLHTTSEANALTVFGGAESFALAQRMGTLLASSTLVPEPYQRMIFNKDSKEWLENHQAIGNCVIALEIAGRLRLSPLMVMQNLDVVKGRPGFRGAFVAALVNSSPTFDRLDYEWKGEPGDTKGRACRAFATERETGKVRYGTWITWEMVTGEHWDNNSKWKTMTDQMFMYRASTFWVRVYASDLLLGMQTREELEDVDSTEHGESLHALNARLEKQLDPGVHTAGDAGDGGDTAPPTDGEDAKPARRRRAPKNAKPPLEQAPPPPPQTAAPAPAGGDASVGKPTAAPDATPPQQAAPAAGDDMFNVE